MRDVIAHEVETMGLDEKRRLVDEPGAAIAEDLVGGSGELAGCPRCGCASFVGKGAAGAGSGGGSAAAAGAPSPLGPGRCSRA